MSAFKTSTSTLVKKTIPIKRNSSPYKERRDQMMPTPGKPRSITFLVSGKSLQCALPQTDGIMIGRGSDSEMVQLDLEPLGGRNAGVSRRHACIAVVDNRVIVRDCNSVNGTHLNGYELPPMHPHRLYDGDKLVLGNMIVEVHFSY